MVLGSIYLPFSEMHVIGRAWILYDFIYDQLFATLKVWKPNIW